MGTIIVVGLAIGFNFIILKWKYDRERYNDLVMDIGVLLILSYLFGGTILGMAAAMVGGMLVSLYLLFANNGDNTSKSTRMDSNPSKDSGIVW